MPDRKVSHKLDTVDDQAGASRNPSRSDNYDGLQQQSALGDPIDLNNNKVDDIKDDSTKHGSNETNTLDGSKESEGLLDSEQKFQPTRSEPDDHSTRLMINGDYSVYNDCTTPIGDHKRGSYFTRPSGGRGSSVGDNSAELNILSESNSSTKLTDGRVLNIEDGAAFMMVDLNSEGRANVGSSDIQDGDDDDDDYYDDLADVRISNKPSNHGEMIQKSFNTLRLNVNNHIIGGSKNVMGKMRKMSMNELNRHGRAAKGRYKVAFYFALTSLSFLFLYLIYQNLFNDK